MELHLDKFGRIARREREMEINSIKAAKMEAAGEGAFSLAGRTIKFRAITGLTYSWPCRTEREAREHLAMFRRSVALVAA